MTPKREWVKEIAAAHRAGDLDTLLALAIELAGRDAHFSARLEADAERKRRQRQGRTSNDVTGHPQTSTEIVDASPFSPGPPFSSPTPTTATTTARDVRVAAAKADLVMKLGGGQDVVVAVDRFAEQVPEAKRWEWLTGMATWLKPITGGRGHAPDVMLAAMADWLIVDRERWPWVGRTFRAFMRDIERQRETPPPRSPNGNGKHRGGSVAQRTYTNGVNALQDIP